MLEKYNISATDPELVKAIIENPILELKTQEILLNRFNNLNTISDHSTPETQVLWTLLYKMANLAKNGRSIMDGEHRDLIPKFDEGLARIIEDKDRPSARSYLIKNSINLKSEDEIH